MPKPVPKPPPLPSGRQPNELGGSGGSSRSVTHAISIRHRRHLSYSTAIEMGTSPQWQSPVFDQTGKILIGSQGTSNPDDRPGNENSFSAMSGMSSDGRENSGDQTRNRSSLAFAQSSSRHDSENPATVDYTQHYFDSTFEPALVKRRKLMKEIMEELLASIGGLLESDSNDDVYVDEDVDGDPNAGEMTGEIPLRYGPGPHRLAMSQKIPALFLTTHSPFLDVRRDLEAFFEAAQSISSTDVDELNDDERFRNFVVSDFFDSVDIYVPETTGKKKPSSENVNIGGNSGDSVMEGSSASIGAGGSSKTSISVIPPGSGETIEIVPVPASSMNSSFEPSSVSGLTSMSMGMDMVGVNNSVSSSGVNVNMSGNQNQSANSSSSSPSPAMHRETESDNEYICSLLSHVFLNPESTFDCSMPTVLLRVLAAHPSYALRLWKLHEKLLHGHGPILQSHRVWISVIAAAQNRSTYVTALQAQLFLEMGGDRSWLQLQNDSTSTLPVKLRRLIPLNAKLCHTPWLVGWSDIEELMSNDDSEADAEAEAEVTSNSSDHIGQKRALTSWSLGEITQALVIMTHFHALSCLASGCGASGDVYSENILLSCAEKSEGECESESVSESESEDGSDAKNEKEKEEKEKEDKEDSKGDSDSDHVLEDHRALLSVLPFEETVDGAEATDLYDAFAHADDRPLHTLLDALHPHTHTHSVSRALDCFGGSSSASMSLPPEFYKRNSQSQDHDLELEADRGLGLGEGEGDWLKFRDFGWNDQCKPFVRTYFDVSVSTMLDDLFTHVPRMTYNTLVTDVGVGTGPFRSAVWHFSQRVFGIWHDDYHYKNVSRYMSERLRDFVKMVCLAPHAIRKELFCQNFGLDLKTSEKVHVVVLAAEARRQASLIYGLRVVQKIRESS